MIINLKKNENAEATDENRLRRNDGSGNFLQLYFVTFAIIQSTYSRIPSNSRHSHLMHISL